MHHLSNFNFWAILVAALFQWFLGALWYSPPLFAKPWMAIVGRQKGDNKSGLATGMISSLICDLILSFVLAHVVIWSGSMSFGHGALAGFIMWAGFIACPSLPQGIYEGRPFKLFSINGGYWLVALLVSGGILAIWR
ncbi:MAG: DUF1761 domain-containing protein [Terracidiphilus sp.]